MAQVKDKLTGQIINVPDQDLGKYGLGSSTGGTTDTAPAGMMGTGAGTGKDQYGVLQQAMLMMALKDPKNASKYSTILGLVPKPKEPTTAELTRQSDIKKADTEKQIKLKKIDRAIELLNKQNLKTGPIAGPLLALKSKWGGASKEESELYSLIGELGAQKMFEIGGKVLPAKEMERLEPFVPLIGVDKQLNLQNLGSFREGLSSVYDSYGWTTSPTSGGGTEIGSNQLPASWQDEEEEEEE